MYYLKTEECTLPTVLTFMAHGCVQGQLLARRSISDDGDTGPKQSCGNYIPSAAFKQKGLDSARVIGIGLQSPLVVIFIPSL